MKLVANSIRLSEDQWFWMKRRANQNNRSLNSEMIIAVREYLKATRTEADADLEYERSIIANATLEP